MKILRKGNQRDRKQNKKGSHLNCLVSSSKFAEHTKEKKNFGDGHSAFCIIIHSVCKRQVWDILSSKFLDKVVISSKTERKCWENGSQGARR